MHPPVGALAELREAHLITISTFAPEPRVEMLETLREFAAARLDELGETASTQAAHAAAFRSLAQRAAVALDGAVDQTRWLERLDGDHDNLVAALTWATEADPDCAVQLAGSLALYWITSGRLDEAKQHLLRLLAAFPAAQDALHGRMLWTVGWISGLQGEPADAIRHYRRSLSIGRAHDDAPLMARSLLGLGRIDLHRGRNRSARTAFEKGLALAGAGSDVWGMPLLL